MSEKSIIVERINNLCKEKRMSYYALSYKSAVPISTLLNIVKESTANPGVFTIGKLCGGLGVTLSEFFDQPEFESIERFEL